MVSPPTEPQRERLLLVVGRPPAATALDAELITELVSADGYVVATSDNGAAALEAVATRRPVAVVLFEPVAVVAACVLCQELRRRGSSIPVGVIATHCCDEARHAALLDAGADDVIMAPIGATLLRARLAALLRRHRADEVSVLTADDVVVDGERRRVTRAGRRIELTATEYRILELMLRNIDIVLPRSTIYERLWGIDLHGSSKSLDVHVGALRRKLERHGDRIIHNVRGVGYVIWAEGGRGHR
ncbi:MAG: response regulator transcription factor [Actinomycetota bacterium]